MFFYEFTCPALITAEGISLRVQLPKTMTFSLTADKLAKLEKQLIDSHQVVMNTTASPMTIASTDGKIAATASFDASKNVLDVELTKHDGIPGFLANAGLKHKLDEAIKAL